MEDDKRQAYNDRCSEKVWAYARGEDDIEFGSNIDQVSWHKRNGTQLDWENYVFGRGLHWHFQSRNPQNAASLRPSVEILGRPNLYIQKSSLERFTLECSHNFPSSIWSVHNTPVLCYIYIPLRADTPLTKHN
jgi:hypothetical protein